VRFPVLSRALKGSLLTTSLSTTPRLKEEFFFPFANFFRDIKNKVKRKTELYYLMRDSYEKENVVEKYSEVFPSLQSSSMI